MNTWRIFGYQVITAAIILLSMIRRKVAGREWELRKDRDELNLIAGYWVSKASGILIECCDCGLAHRFWEDERGTHCWPERPAGYKYTWRFGR